MIGPAGRPLTNPSATTIGSTAPLRGSSDHQGGEHDAPATRMSCRTPGAIGQKSAERNGHHRDPQHDADGRSGRCDRPAAFDQHRRPEAEDDRKADIEQAPDQARGDHGERGVAIETLRRRRRTSAAAVGRRLVQGREQHDAAGDEGGDAEMRRADAVAACRSMAAPAAQTAMPAGQELTKIAIAVAISLPANQSVTILVI